MASQNFSSSSRILIAFQAKRPPADAPEEGPLEEFLCPVSRNLMEDPVVVLTGHSFERAVVEVGEELGYFPPVPMIRSIPNLALKGAILTWCDIHGLPSPSPLTQEAARSAVVEMIKTGGGGGGVGGKSHGGNQETSTTTPSEGSASTIRAVPLEGDSQESAVEALLQKAESCNPRAVAMVALLLDPDQPMKDQFIASKVFLALSTKESNRMKIAGNGALQPLLHVLAGGSTMGLRVEAAFTLRNLAEEPMNRAFMGDHGSIPFLLAAFSDRYLTLAPRRDAALALQFLLSCPSNITLLSRVAGAVPRLLSMATVPWWNNKDATMQIYAIRLVVLMSSEADTRLYLINCGAVGLIQTMIRDGYGTDAMDVCCYRIRYNLCYNPKFNPTPVAEDNQTLGQSFKDIAKRMIKAFIEDPNWIKTSSGIKQVPDKGKAARQTD